MRLLLCILLVFSCPNTKSQNINKLQDKLQAYFRHLPYNKDFYDWLNEFKTDPLYRIDTSITLEEHYSAPIILKGTAKYQPFMLEADHVKFFITKFGLHNPWTKKADSLTNIYVYLFVDSALSNKKIVVDEYKRLNKEFARFFAKNNDYKKTEKGKIVEQTNNYMLDKLDQFPTLIINWHRDKVTKNYFIGVSMVVTINKTIPI
jgi:hypothetical protein